MCNLQLHRQALWPYFITAQRTSTTDNWLLQLIQWSRKNARQYSNHHTCAYEMWYDPSLEKSLNTVCHLQLQHSTKGMQAEVLYLVLAYLFNWSAFMINYSSSLNTRPFYYSICIVWTTLWKACCKYYVLRTGQGRSLEFERCIVVPNDPSDETAVDCLNVTSYATSISIFVVILIVFVSVNVNVFSGIVVHAPREFLNGHGPADLQYACHRCWG